MEEIGSVLFRHIPSLKLSNASQVSLVLAECECVGVGSSCKEDRRTARSCFRCRVRLSRKEWVTASLCVLTARWTTFHKHLATRPAGWRGMGGRVTRSELDGSAAWCFERTNHEHSVFITITLIGSKQQSANFDDTMHTNFASIQIGGESTWKRLVPFCFDTFLR